MREVRDGDRHHRGDRHHGGDRRRVGDLRVEMSMRRCLGDEHLAHVMMAEEHAVEEYVVRHGDRARQEGSGATHWIIWPR